MKIQPIALPLLLSVLALPLTAQIAPLPVSSLAEQKQAAPAPMAASAPTAVPALIPFSGVVAVSDGRIADREAAMTFLIYTGEQGGDPLWTETQSVAVDATGRYKVQLGAANPNGLPAELFSSGEARWLEVQVSGQSPQPRVLLSSVPYAMKSADAESLAGHPAADFITRSEWTQATASAARAEQAAMPELAPSGTGTPNTIPIWATSSTLGNSIITESSGKIGINFAAPTATLEVGGGMTVHGTLAFPPGQPATAAHSSASQQFSFTASAWNSTTAAPVNSTYTMQAGPTGNNTATPSSIFYFNYQNGTTPAVNLFTVNGKGVLGLANPAGGILSNGNISLAPGTIATAAAATNSPLLEIGASSYSSASSVAKAQTFAWQAQGLANNTASPSGALALLYGANGATPAATGLSIAPNGQITFATGQTFPGSGSGGGTITGVSTSSPLTGSGTSGSVAIGLNTAALETTLNSQYAQLSAANTFTQPITFASGQTFPGAGTITGVTAGPGLTGGGASGSVTLNVDSTQVPLLSSINTFTKTNVFDGAIFLPALGTATAASPAFNSAPLYISASAYDSSTSAARIPGFEWQAEAQNGNTASPSATLNLLQTSGVGRSGYAETGLSINQAGILTFNPSQTFPNTVSSVTAASPLSVINVNGQVGLSLNMTTLENSLNSVYPTLTGSNNFTGQGHFSGGGLLASTSGAGADSIEGEGSSGASGVIGTSDTGTGIGGYTQSGTAVFGAALGDGYAGYFANASYGYPTLYAINTEAGGNIVYPVAITGTTTGKQSTAINGLTHGSYATSVLGYATGTGSVGVSGYSEATSSQAHTIVGTGVSGNAAQGIGFWERRDRAPAIRTPFFPQTATTLACGAIALAPGQAFREPRTTALREHFKTTVHRLPSLPQTWDPVRRDGSRTTATAPPRCSSTTPVLAARAPRPQR